MTQVATQGRQTRNRTPHTPHPHNRRSSKGHTTVEEVSTEYSCSGCILHDGEVSLSSAENYAVHQRKAEMRAKRQKQQS